MFGYIGNLTEVSLDIPTENLAMQADFPVSGRFYYNENYPDVLYGCLTLEHQSEYWIRFVSAKLRRTLFCVDGDVYSIDTDRKIESKPDMQYLCIGKLVLANDNLVPATHLTTNNQYYAGCNVWKNPNDTHTVYIEKANKTRNGENIRYLPAVQG